MFSILDIETTGGKFDEEGITEIAIHRYDGHEVTDTFISLVNPERPIQPYVQKLTGINGNMLRSAPKFHEVAKRVVEITQNTVLVAHNAQFDYRILRTEFRRLGYDFQRETLCTVDLAKRLIPEAESHSLGKLARSLGIPVSDRHRANGDALATLGLLKVLLTRDTSKTIIREIIRPESLGELSDRQLSLVRSVPDDTGVYYLYDKDGEILYLDSSSDMKKGVNLHFTGEGLHSRVLRKRTRQVQFERTGSRLLADLKAHNEIRANRPPYLPKRKKPKAVKCDELHINGQQYVLGGKGLLLLDKGREQGERAAIWLCGEGVRGMGFVTLNHQIQNIHILEKLMSPPLDATGSLQVLVSSLSSRKVLKVIEL